MDTIDGIITLLLLFAGLCFIAKLGFLWMAIAALFRRSPPQPDPAEVADEAITKARHSSKPMNTDYRR